MTGAELAAEVKKVVRDSDYDEDDILVYLNEGLNAIAGVVHLKDLEQIKSDVTTDTAADNIALPDDYMRELMYVNSVTNEVCISPPGRSIEYLKFRRRHPVPDTGTYITDVGVRGERLYYYPTPESEETLELAYLRKPVTFSLTETPEAIPSHLHRKLLGSYAAWVIFGQIEDGIEGPQVNTDRQWKNYISAIAELKSYLGEIDSEPGYVADEFWL